MAVATTLKQRTHLGNARMNVADIALAAEEYLTGGIVITAAKLGLVGIYSVMPVPAAGYIFEFDHDNLKLKAYTPLKAHAAHDHANSLSMVATNSRLSHSGADILGSGNTDAMATDEDASPTNGAVVHALASVGSDGAVTLDTFTNPDIGRNLCVVLKNNSGGELVMDDGEVEPTPITVSVEITGTWRGVVQTETIDLVFTVDNKTIANTKFRYQYGVKPFDTITAATVTGFLAAHEGMQVSLGLGSKVGLPADLATPAEADVISINRSASWLDPDGIVDTTNMTVNLGTIADNADFTIVYQGSGFLTEVSITNAEGGAIAAAAAAEVDAGTAITATVRVIAIGI